MKKYIFITIIGIILIMPSVASSATYEMDEVKRFAESEGLDVFKKLMLEDPEGYGFKNTAQIESVVVGDGLPIYWVDAGKLRAADANTSLQSILRPSNQWEFTVFVDGTATSFLTIGEINHALDVVAAGGTSEAFDKAYKKISVHSDPDSSVILAMIEGTHVLVSSVDHQEVALSESNVALYGEQKASLIPSENVVTQLKVSQNAEEQENDGGVLVLNQSVERDAKPVWRMAAISGGIAIAAAWALQKAMNRKKKAGG
ncbi:hypothetical protein IDH44_02875 [Paenibacillus sp. IB182496]|uniref:Uncharacterized protein n=1 Tax=Paenibacillus sabuli TaxID=2772509 RepID=A0A927BRG6_9BACL|nr:hypothetical protein [Paenibacillus sabuli]MBD2844118.1 hypothetical protein [Paenibacillus sabuli]